MSVVSHIVVSISGITISNGKDTPSGGGIFSDTTLDGVTTTITNSTISGNTVGNGGGGVANADGLTVIEFSTITNNTAANDQGSGVLSRSNSSTRTEVLSSIISANTNTDMDFFEGTTNPFLSGGFNLIGDGNATGAFNQTGDQINVADPGLDPLGSYGGPTQTHRLQSDSPALDAALRCPPPATDQRGVTRPQDGNADSTPGCDIGSFELEEPSDITAPRVKWTVPGVNALDVAPTVNVKAKFSEEMDSDTINGKTFKLFEEGTTTKVAAAVSYDASTHKAKLNPTDSLQSGVTYRAVVTTGAEDLAGNPLDQKPNKVGNQKKTWTFTVS